MSQNKFTNVAMHASVRLRLRRGEVSTEEGIELARVAVSKWSRHQPSLYSVEQVDEEGDWFEVDYVFSIGSCPGEEKQLV